jgi:peptidoglycan/xylan/chitin deacetylase (PgdA/CDA1 family)
MRSAANLVAPPAIILLYHRVNALASDPQRLCVSPKNFGEQLEIVRRLGEPITLSTIDDVLHRGTGGRRQVVVTFDDGYADNLHNAKPQLERFDVPATVFVATRHVRAGSEFWQDELEKMLLRPGVLPDTLRLDIRGTTYQWELGPASHYDDAAYQEHFRWNVSRRDTPTPRHEIYRSLCDRLLPLTVDERLGRLEELRRWSRTDAAARPTHAPLTESELGELGRDGLVEIGSHTVSHAMLAALPKAAQQEEIVASKRYLEEVLGRPVTSFAYPYGGRAHYNGDTVDVVRDAGFARACSNFEGVVRSGVDRLQLPRFLVRDWPGDEFEARLRTWLTH